MLAKKGYEKNDVLVHNKLDSKRLYVDSKGTYDGFGRTARKNASNLAQAEFAEVLKHVARRTPGKKYITGGGELLQVEPKIRSIRQDVQVQK